MIGPPIVVVMGVCGCGKSSVGRGLAQALGCAFIEGDAHHPEANIAKMSAGVPLTDADREGWLAVLAGFIADADRRSEALVVACSALKRRYRDQLRGDSARVRFLHLDGTKAVIADRMAARTAHFMPTALIDSQFADLEAPGPEENALTRSILLPVDQIVADACGYLTNNGKAATATAGGNA
ncbi:gluconokinase [Azospirillum griseum]|uniref:gluconokinase n=1 Tax=Azospirillum griseum TaxID=2496639 RepID=UPI001FE73D66|nr:gluconokinase [Azospirillum griseum]